MYRPLHACPRPIPRRLSPVPMLLSFQGDNGLRFFHTSSASALSVSRLCSAFTSLRACLLADPLSGPFPRGFDHRRYHQQPLRVLPAGAIVAGWRSLPPHWAMHPFHGAHGSQVSARAEPVAKSLTDAQGPPPPSGDPLDPARPEQKAFDRVLLQDPRRHQRTAPKARPAPPLCSPAQMGHVGRTKKSSRSAAVAYASAQRKFGQTLFRLCGAEKSAKNSDAGLTPETSSLSRARVQAT